MLRHRDQLLNPPHSLRRRRQSQTSEAGPLGSDVRSSNLLPRPSTDVLDLSICHPRQLFSNRFSALATPPLSAAKPPSLLRHVATTNARRTRNSRGTKEAKKRRDMRRNKRKMAAQLLDQQISQAIDETLIRANFPAPTPPRACLLPAMSASLSTLPTNDFPLPQPACLQHTPPELPFPDFSAFDLSTFPQLSALPSAPSPLRTPSPFGSLPKWCPRIPSLTLGDVWRDCLPTFYDLSSLPEPTETQDLTQDTTMDACKDLQIWCPTSFGRERSRFFPPRSLLTAEEQGLAAERKARVARVKLPPPIGCRMHASDEGVGSSVPTPKSFITQAAIAALAEMNESFLDRSQSQRRRFNMSDSEKEKVEIVTSADEISSNDIVDESTYVALWTNFASIASNNSSFNDAHHAQNNTPYSNDFTSQHDTDQAPPYELDSRETELPYVHANSLVGLSNGSADTVATSYYRPQPLLADSGVDLPVVRLAENDDVGSTEMVIAPNMILPIHEVLAADVPLSISLPATPPATPPLCSIGDIAALLPIDCVAEDECHNSDAHYNSEQALFVQSPPSPAQSTATLRNQLDCGSINVAEFLKLGHAKQCWCGYCDDDSYSDAVAKADLSSSSSVTLAGQDPHGDDEELDDDDDDSTLSLILNHSVSESDDDKGLPELLDHVNTCATLTSPEHCKDEIPEDDGWLLCPTPTTETTDSTLPPYLPSSPILHRQRQQRSTTPAIVITSSDASADNQSEDYIAVPAPETSSVTTLGKAPTWAEMFPRLPSSAWEAGLTQYGDEGVGCGFANAVEGSWRWGRESEEEWWDWAVEEEC